MRVLIQRVKSASVTIKGAVYSKIERGLLVFVGIEDGDNSEDIKWLVGKLTKMRIFDDENGVMNCSVMDIGGETLVVSQFTLHASTKKGNRPSYIRAAKPEVSYPLYEEFLKTISQEMGVESARGVFGAEMDVELVNDGPVTIIMDSKNRE